MIVLMNITPASALIVISFVLSTFILSAEEKRETPERHLFILSGQSNMTRGLADSFRNSVEQVFGKDEVLVVMHGRPGLPIKKWCKSWKPPEGMTDDKPEGNGEIYDQLMGAVKKQLKDERPATVTFIWMQGEQDAGSSWASVYEKSFFAMLDQIKGDLKIDDLNFVVGRINDFWLEKPDGDAMRKLLQKLGDENDNGAWVNTDDLNRGVNPWGGFSFEDGHYPPSGYTVMGQRFAKKACLLIDPKMELDPRPFVEHFIDSHEQIKSHAAIGKKVEGGSAALTDGKFGGVDHTEKSWMEIKPSEKPVEIVVDLGEPTVVDELGINILLSSKANAELKGKFVYSTSEDGETFVVNNNRYNTVQAYNRKAFNGLRSAGIEPQSVLLLTRQHQRSGPVTARKVKIEIHNPQDAVFLDEVVVNPKKD